MSAPLTGVVLAGGLGRRMGGPKALLPGLDGRPLVVGALEALRAAGAGPLLVVARDGLQARELGPALAAAPGPPAIVCDRLADRGPLAGLEAALSAATTPWSLVVACDMPALDPALLASIAARALALDDTARGPAPVAVVPRVAGADGVVHPQPLHAAWSRRARPAITAALAAGRLALKDLLRDVEVAWLDLGPSPSFTDWDVPADRAQRRS